MEHQPDVYCRSLCPLLSNHRDVPWVCQEHCNYEPRSKLWEPAAPRPPYRRTISQFVKRDPREFYHAHPVQPWMYGVITGNSVADLGFPLPDGLERPGAPAH